MKTLGIACLLFLGVVACVRPSGPEASSETADQQLVIHSPEFLELSTAYGRLLSFWDDPLFVEHGFSANSPYADWLSYVLSLQKKTNYSPEPPRLLAMLAMACKQYGLESSLTQDFKARFEHELGRLRSQPQPDPKSRPSVVTP